MNGWLRRVLLDLHLVKDVVVVPPPPPPPPPQLPPQPGVAPLRTDIDPFTAEFLRQKEQAAIDADPQEIARMDAYLQDVEQKTRDGATLDAITLDIAKYARDRLRRG